MIIFSFLPALSVALVAGSAALLRAQVQTPFFAKDGLKSAQQKAGDSLGSDIDLTESFISNDFRFADFDSRALPAGLYYSRAAGSGWGATTGVIVESGDR